MTTYTNPFTGQTISPSQVGYEQLVISTDIELQWPVNGNTDSVVANIIEVDATVAGLSVRMPPAEQVSLGQSTLMNNIGANPFDVLDNAGGFICTVASGAAQYIWVTDNTTVAGTYDSITFGAGTSAANAATLAGYGLLALSNTLNQAYNVQPTFSDVTLDNTDRATFIVWESGVGTITLPPSGDVGNNWFVMIRNNGTGILTLTPQGLDTIDGNPTQQLQLTESLVLCCNGSGFNTFGLGRNNEFAFTILAKSVTGGTVTLTAPEAANVIQEYYGTLTTNCNVVFPSTVQLYSLQNNTSGAYSLTFKTAAVGGATLTLAQGETVIAICDGTNVYNSQTAASSTLQALTLGNGSAAAPSLRFIGSLTTGLYLPAANQLGFALNGISAGVLKNTGLQLTVGINSGTF